MADPIDYALAAIRLKEWRLHHHMTQKALAQALGLGQDQLAKIENGSRRLKEGELLKALGVFGLSLPQYLAGPGGAAPQGRPSSGPAEAASHPPAQPTATPASQFRLAAWAAALFAASILLYVDKYMDRRGPAPTATLPARAGSKARSARVRPPASRGSAGSPLADWIRERFPSARPLLEASTEDADACAWISPALIAAPSGQAPGYIAASSPSGIRRSFPARWGSSGYGVKLGKVGFFASLELPGGAEARAVPIRIEGAVPLGESARDKRFTAALIAYPETAPGVDLLFFLGSPVVPAVLFHKRPPPFLTRAQAKGDAWSARARGVGWTIKASRNVGDVYLESGRGGLESLVVVSAQTGLPVLKRGPLRACGRNGRCVPVVEAVASSPGRWDVASYFDDSALEYPAMLLSASPRGGGFEVP